MSKFLNNLINSISLKHSLNETPIMRLFRIEYHKDYRYMQKYGILNEDSVISFLKSQKRIA